MNKTRNWLPSFLKLKPNNLIGIRHASHLSALTVLHIYVVEPVDKTWCGQND